MEFVPVIALAALVKDFINFLKFLSGRDTNAVVTQLTVWVGGIAAVFLAASTTFAEGIQIGDRSLGTLTNMDQLFVGLLISGIASTLYQAIDARAGDSTVRNNLVGTPPK